MVNSARWLAALVVSAAVAVPGLAAAQTTTQAPTASAVGTGSGWQADVQANGVVGQAFSAEELALVEDVNNYFNAIVDLNGQFVQTDAQQQRARGKFYVNRPGRFRFVYSPPSKLVILSDGTYLSIEDYDLQTVERYSLNSTPFRILLADTVDLIRDSRLVDIQRDGATASVTLIDKENETNGKLRLLFDRTADNSLALKAWVVTDAQGLDTSIAVANLTFGETADPKLFRPSKVGLANAFSSER